MSMVDLMWLFCGAFIGGLVTLFFMAMVNAGHEAEALEQARRKIQALEEDKRALKNALTVDNITCAGQSEIRTCAICGMEYTGRLNCPHCGSTATVALLKELEMSE